MRPLFSLIFIFLIAGAQPYAQANLSDFFLGEYLNRDIKAQLDLSVSPIQFETNLTEYDLACTKNPITYTGSISRPFSSDKPVIVQHAVSLSFIRPRFSAGLQIGGNFQLLRSHIDNQNSIQSGTTIIDAILYEDIDHLRINFSVTGNSLAQIGASQLTLALTGNLIQHHGYELVKTPASDYSSVYSLRDFDPADLSGGVSGGVLFSIPADVFGSPMLHQISIQGCYRNENIPLHAPSEVNNLSRDDSFDWYGSRTDTKQASLTVVSRPYHPENRSQQTMILSGRYLYGIRLSEVSLEFLAKKYMISNVRYSSNTLADTAGLFFWSTEYFQKVDRIKISPEIFFASWLSCVLNLSAVVDEKAFFANGFSVDRPPLTLDVGSSIDINFYHRSNSGKELIVSLNSGELTTSFQRRQYYSSTNSYYKGYLIALKVSVLGLL